MKAATRAALLVLLATAPAGASGLPAVPVAVVVTTDCGADMDDQWAIAHAALSPRLRTLAIVTNFAPEPHELDAADTARCAREALKAVGRSAEVPVLEGADAPLPDRATPARNPGVDHLLRLSTAFSPDNRLLVLALGPATDIASAVLLDPTLADRIEVAALAFDAYPEGGDGWNVRNDVPAWQVLLDAAIPVTTASGPVTLANLSLTAAEAAAMARDLGTPGAYLACLHAAWLGAFGAEFAAETGGPDRWPVWDEAVVAVVLGLTAQRDLPRPALADDASFLFPNARSRAPYRWVNSIDRERLLGDLAGLLGQVGDEADGTSPPVPGPGAAATGSSPSQPGEWAPSGLCQVGGGWRE